MAGYTRQSSASIQPGEDVDAGPLNNEFDAIQTAFGAGTGHIHDGSTGNAPQINLTTSVTGALPILNGGTGSTTASGARTNLGLGSMAVQNSTGVSITGGTADALVIGGSTPAAGAFTTIDASGLVQVTDSGPFIKLNDTGGYGFWLHANSNKFYVLVDRTGDGSWDGEHPLALDAATNSGTIFGGTIWNSLNDGAGSTLDADLLDGQHGSYYAPKASPTFTGSVVVPTGSWSGGTINATTIGASTPSSGAFTTLSASGEVVSNILRTDNGAELILSAGESHDYITGLTSENVYAVAEGGFHVISSPDNWASGWAGRQTAVINNSNGDSSFPGDVSATGNVTADGDFRVSSSNDRGIKDVTGSYGTIQTTGAGAGSFAGYSIDGKVVFMSNSSIAGLYDDINNQWFVNFTFNGAADLRYAGAAKLTTTSSGVTITGTATATAFSGSGAGLTGVNATTLDSIDSGSFIRSDVSDDVNATIEWQDNYEVRLGSSADFRMKHDGGNTVLDNYTGSLYLRNFTNSGNIFFQCDDAGGVTRSLIHLEDGLQVRLFYQGSEKLSTTSGGVNITGDIDVTGQLLIGTSGGGDSAISFHDDNSNTERGLVWDDSTNYFAAEDNASTYYPLAMFSTTTSASTTTFPLGHIVACSYGNDQNRNGSTTVRLYTGNNIQYINTGTGSILTGTWRARGLTSNSIGIMQRVA